ncbi:DUF262 domain-containing protein [Tenacibaculum sp. 1_MG-2023]|uniref:DUF262 domain-containing protein n=1 Tax=Tenacibaculum sp. 1_MG-2023 TaxID=3062653 RepID=UPI0026E3A827|nr:DUF262 domain-containing protein [Tenacibaculum sp. 1_MG-2023]MDO6676906.1 DUF262 domain-containing protein [Tenacibaculum sp. 1_MG-2023]
MENINNIFNNKLFRIPDYQRGYSWEKSHLEDFWQDLINLQKKRIHYTGMISVESVKSSEFSKWKDDKWLIDGKKYEPFFIVDGQQRLTSIIILLWVIVNDLGHEEELSYSSKSELIDKYIFTENDKKGFKSYLFGYHKDNPSYEYLKREIFEQNDNTNRPIIETVYTNNLLNAKRFFTERVRKLGRKEKEILYNKITQQLKFDFKVLEEELDIFIVFETMNNRGKPLSNLEKLKNRLIYLSTQFKDLDDDYSKEDLRDDINEHWKTIYKYLGLNKDKRLEDDAFLQSHWIMYYRYERREPEFYAKDIFDRYFTSANVLDGTLKYLEIKKYIESISEAVKQWFVMYNPSHPHALELTQSKELLFWLKKQNRIGFKAFAPLIMGAFLIEKDNNVKIELIKSTESYVFLIFDVSFRRSNTGTYHFNAKANELFKGEVSTEQLIKDIKYWVYGNDEYHGYFDTVNFYSFMKDLFVQDKTNGYADWKYLKYFLYEYELYLSNQFEADENWNKMSVIEAVLPHRALKNCWREHFHNFKQHEKKKLSGSLGNLILTQTKNRFADEKCFDDKKLYFNDGSFNEEEIAQYENWDEKSILHRGLKILDFMESRWNIEIGDEEEKKKLLFLDFLN